MSEEELKLEEEKKKEEETLKNAETVNMLNALAQNDALVLADEQQASLEAENSNAIDEEIVEAKAEEVAEPTISADEPAKIEETADRIEEPTEEQKVEEPVEDTDNDINSEDEDFNALVDQRFAMATQKDREDVNKAVEEIKKSHPDDYDAYVEKLKKTRYYKKSLEKWTKYYSELKEKCAEEVRGEIETAAMENAIATENVQAPIRGLSTKNDIQNEIVDEGDEKIISEATAPTAEPMVEDIEVDNYVALASDGKMVVDKNLRKTVEEVLLDAFYASFDETSDFYNRLNSETNESKKDNKIVEFRNELANNLQQVHNKVFPNESKPYMPYIESLQRDIENRNGNMNINSVAEQIFDKFYHIDVDSKQTSGMIPSLADDLAAKIQDILIANGIIEFNLSKDNVEKILNRLVKESELGKTLYAKNKRLTGVLDIISVATKEISSIKNDEFKYDESKIERYRYLLGQCKIYNPDEEENYSKLVSIFEKLEDCKKLLDQNNISYKNSKEAKEAVKLAEDTLKQLKTNTKTNESLNSKSDKKLMNEPNKTKAISDYMTMKLIKKATKDFARNSLNNFNYTNEEVEKDLSDITGKLKIDGENKTITSDTMDTVNLMIQEFIVKEEKKYLENKESVDAYLDEVTRITGVLEEDEAKQKIANYTEEDAKNMIENQKYARVLIADFTHLQKVQSKKNLTSEEVKNLDLGLVK